MAFIGLPWPMNKTGILLFIGSVPAAAACASEHTAPRAAIGRVVFRMPRRVVMRGILTCGEPVAARKGLLTNTAELRTGGTDLRKPLQIYGLQRLPK
jgi:hypothetical protein